MTLVTAGSEIKVPRASKFEVADRILDRAVELRNG